MPLDPNFPPPNAALISAQWRAQFAAIQAQFNTQAAQIAALQSQVAQLESDLAGTARNPNGQFVNFDPNWSPSGDTTTDCIYLRDRLTDLYNIEAR